MKKSTQYINFARKYRPINFSELKGQEVLTKILNYSIINNKLASGYLLTGIRGVGKTTSARIIAKTINCSQITVDDGKIVPCENCQNCQSSAEQRHPDIIEIDAASKTGVEDIRDIIESSEYRPLLGKYKVFIIDEVHMLSKSAFNALLKVLEEPPPHIVFIFATTEVQKIPLTIISRCQRYDLRRLTFDEILELITTIIQKEQLKFDPEALRLIAFKSEGSARDAVKLLDQASSLNVGEENISAEMINKMLGCVDVKVIISLLKHVVDKDAEKAIELINELYQLSANMENLIESAADFTAYLSKAKILNNYSIPQFFDYKELINNILIETNVARLSILWQIFNKGLNEVKISHNLLLAVEMIIIKAIYSHSIPDPENLVNVLTQPTIKDSSNSPQKIDDKPLVRKEIITDTVKIEPKIVKINDFLEYLHANFEMDIYYLLLNNVELKKFGDEVIEIAVENINNNSKEQIGSLLFAWTGKKWNVIIQKQHEIVTLKEQIINRVESDEDWKILKKHFPSARISDLLLKA